MSEHVQLACSNGILSVARNYLSQCDHAHHLLRGKEKLERNEVVEMCYAKRHPVAIVSMYFGLFKRSTRQLTTNEILQVIDLILTDGRGEIYKSQGKILGDLCSIISERASKSSNQLELTNQLLTLVPFANLDVIHHTLLTIRRYLDLAGFNESIEELAQQTNEFTRNLPSGIQRVIGDDEFTLGMLQRRDQFAQKRVDVEVIKLIGITYSYFKFLFPFDQFTFTSCNQRGRQGPSLANCIKEYEPFWATKLAYFNVEKDGYQRFTVPETGKYHFELVGAGDLNGAGTRIADEFDLTINDRLTIAIGQCGTSGGGGGHGASVVWHNGQVLMVAGGGGHGQVRDYEAKWMKKIKCLRGNGASLGIDGNVHFDRLVQARSLDSTGAGGTGEFLLQVENTFI